MFPTPFASNRPLSVAELNRAKIKVGLDQLTVEQTLDGLLSEKDTNQRRILAIIIADHATEFETAVNKWYSDNSDSCVGSNNKILYAFVSPVYAAGGCASNPQMIADTITNLSYTVSVENTSYIFGSKEAFLQKMVDKGIDLTLADIFAEKIATLFNQQVIQPSIQQVITYWAWQKRPGWALNPVFDLVWYFTNGFNQKITDIAQTKIAQAQQPVTAKPAQNILDAFLNQLPVSAREGIVRVAFRAANFFDGIEVKTLAEKINQSSS